MGNDLAEVIPSDIDMQQYTQAEAAALIIIRRYEEIIGGGAQQVVFSSERVCGWGGAHMCSDEDDATYPKAPTDSKYLNAGGYIGPAAALDKIITRVLQMASQAKS